MTDHEIDDWIAMLGTSDTRRLAVIHELLRHKVGDELSAADARICLIAVERLKARLAKAH